MTKCCLILLCLTASCFMWCEASPFFFNIQKSYVSQPSRGNSQTTVTQNTDFGLSGVISKWLSLSQIFTDKLFGTTQRPRAIQRPVVQVDSTFTAEKLSETTTNAPAEKEVREEAAALTTRIPTTSMLISDGTTTKSPVEIELPNRIMIEATTEGTTAKTGMDILSNENEPTTKLMTEGTTAETLIETLPVDEVDELSKEELPEDEDITTSKTTTASFSAGVVTDKIFGTTQWVVDDKDATSMLPKTTTEVPAVTKTESVPLSNVGDTQDLTEDADITAAKSEIDNIASLIENDSTPKPLVNAGDTEASIEDLPEDADITAAKSEIDNIASLIEKDSTPVKDTPAITFTKFPTGRVRATTYKPIPTKVISGYQYTKPANQFVRTQPTRPFIPSQKITPPTSNRFSQDGISYRAEPRPFDILSVNGRFDNSAVGGFMGADTSNDVPTGGIDPRLYYFLY